MDLREYYNKFKISSIQKDNLNEVSRGEFNVAEASVSSVRINMVKIIGLFCIVVMCIISYGSTKFMQVEGCSNVNAPVKVSYVSYSPQKYGPYLSHEYDHQPKVEMLRVTSSSEKQDYHQLYDYGKKIWEKSCSKCHANDGNVVLPLADQYRGRCDVVGYHISSDMCASVSYYLYGLPSDNAKNWVSKFIKKNPVLDLEKYKDITERPADVILRNVCLSCHEYQKEGGHSAPVLDSLSNRYTELSLKEWLRSPKRINSKTLMPQVPMTDDELDKLVRLLLKEDETSNIGKGSVVFNEKCAECHYFNSVSTIDEIRIPRSYLFHDYRNKNASELTGIIEKHISNINNMPTDTNINLTEGDLIRLSAQLLKMAPPSILYESCLACHSFKGEGNGLYALDLAYSTFGTKHQDFMNANIYSSQLGEISDLILRNEPTYNIMKNQELYLKSIDNNDISEDFEEMIDRIYDKNDFIALTFDLLLKEKDEIQKEVRDLDRHERDLYCDTLLNSKLDMKKLEKKYFNAWKVQSIKDFLSNPILFDNKGRVRYLSGKLPLEMPRPHLNQEEINALSRFLSMVGDQNLAYSNIMEKGKCLTCHTSMNFVGGPSYKHGDVIIDSDSVNPFPVRYTSGDKSGIDFIDASFDLNLHSTKNNVDLDDDAKRNLKEFLFDLNSKTTEISKSFVENGCIVCHPFYSSDLTMNQKALKKLNGIDDKKGINYSNMSLINLDKFINNHHQENQCKLDKDIVGKDVKEINTDSIVKIRKFIGKIQQGAIVAPVVYSAKMCSACHRIDEKGGASGPDLSKIGKIRTSEYLTLWLRNPWDVKNNTRMPHVNLSELEINDLVHFLSALR